jgi:succinyl-diaminopimelate desuccinylase
MPGRLDRALARADACGPAQVRELAAWLAIPSVSGQPARRADLLRAARFLSGQLGRAGARTSLLPGPTAPVVIGRVAGPPGTPVVAVYGHYDVQPAGPGWSSPAFRPILSAGRLAGRGANDDKGQLFAVIAALRAWHDAGGPPCTVVVIAEGAEEIGSPGLPAALARIARWLRPDVVLACDTERAADGVPAITVSQRGHAALLLRVDTGGQPVHAGRLGGAVADPSLVLARVLSRMQAALAAAAGDAAAPNTAAVVTALAGPGADYAGSPVPVAGARPDDSIRRAAPGRATAGRNLDQKITDGPALSVVWLRAGTGRAAIPARAQARLDVRLPPAADVGAAVRYLAHAARAAAPAGVRVTVRPGPVSPGFAALPRPAALAAAGQACRAVYGQPLALVRSGGTLPAAVMLARAFGQPPMLLGLGTPGGGAHGPDEYLDLAGWQQAVRLLVCLLARPLAPAPARPSAAQPRARAIGPARRPASGRTAGRGVTAGGGPAFRPPGSWPHLPRPDKRPCYSAGRQRVWPAYGLPSVAQLDRSYYRPITGRTAL